MVAGAAIFSILASASVLEFDPGTFFADESEPIDVAVPDQSKERRSAERERSDTPIIRVLNAGTVVEDPVRHAAAIAAMERAASAPAGIVTDDDDLTPTGTVADWYQPKLKSFRTVCVRLCDGALTPISFATTRDRLALDALRCRKSCNSPSKLYIQKNPATDSEALVDLDGKPYAELSTAFKFRTNYDDACTCRPHAWQRTAQARHKIHEIQARSRSGHQVARGRLAAIKTAVAKSSGQSVAAASSKLDRGIVTGSAGRSSQSEVVAAAPIIPRPLVEATVDAATGTAKPVRTMVARNLSGKGSGKLSGKRKAKTIALASAKAARTKANATLVVLFGSAPDLGSQAVGEVGTFDFPPKRLISASAGARRYDGRDWRISIYEPM